MIIYPRLPTIDDLTMIASWLCDEDRRELAVTRDADDYFSLARDAYGSHIKWVADDVSGRPVFAFGAYPLEPGLAQVWGFKTKDGWRAVRTVTKHIRNCMIPELRAMGIRRAVCLVHPDNARSQKWLAHLGFIPSATLQGIGARREEMLLYRRDEPDAVH